MHLFGSFCMTVAGILFISGLAVLNGGKGN